jgi:hypothetical protein
VPDSAAERNRRSRLHRAGDHSAWTSRCAVVRAAGGPGLNGVPAGAGPIGEAVDAYVSSLHLSDGDSRSVMAACARRLAQVFDTAPGREIPSLSRELQTSLAWLAEAGDAGEKLDEIRSQRLLRLTNSILSEVDAKQSRRQQPWPADDEPA